MNIDRQQFTDALALAVKVIDRKPVNLTLAAVKMTFGDTLTLEATNQSRFDSVQASVPYSGEKCMVLVDGHKLFEIVKQLPDETLGITINEKFCIGKNIKLSITQGQFPPLPEPVKEGVLFTAEAFQKLIKTALCGIKEETFLEGGKALGCVHLVAKDGFHCYAGDGKKLSMTTGDCTGEGEFYLPISMLRHMQVPAEFTLSQDKNHFFVSTDYYTYSCRKTTSFVNLQDFWNRLNFEITEKVEKEPLQKSLELIRSILDPFGTQGILWQWMDNQLLLTGKSGAGEIEQRLKTATMINGDFPHHADWILSILGNIDGDMTVGVNGRAMKLADENSAYIIMALNFC